MLKDVSGGTRANPSPITNIRHRVSACESGFFDAVTDVTDSFYFSLSTLLSADAEAHFTDHSKRPAESPSGNVTSRRSDFVRTGAKFTVEGVPRYVG